MRRSLRALSGGVGLPPAFQLNCMKLFPSSWGSTSLPTSPAIFTHGTVVMLNSPQALPSFFRDIWTQTTFRSCADGAVNRLYDVCINDPSILDPHVCVGDMDSARPEVLRHYEMRGCAVVRRQCQDTTDLQKVLAYDAVEDARRHRGGSTAVLGGLGGFLSHQLANLSESLEQSLDRVRGPLFFLGEEDICFVLPRGLSIMYCPLRLNCSLIPLFGTVDSVQTTGLRWNLSGQKMAFGSCISTSNHVAEDAISVESSHPILWVFDKRASSEVQ